MNDIVYNPTEEELELAKKAGTVVNVIDTRLHPICGTYSISPMPRYRKSSFGFVWDRKTDSKKPSHGTLIVETEGKHVFINGEWK